MAHQSDGITVDHSDDALGRTMRAIVMIADGAIQSLNEMGWTRKTVNLEVDQNDPLPCWVTLRGKRVFEIRPTVESGSVVIEGVWLEKIDRPGIIERFWGNI